MKKKKVVKKSMAKRRFAKSRSYIARARGFGSKGGIMGLLTPIGAGVIDSYLDPIIPIDGVGAAGMGFFFHNNTIKNIGLYKIGMSLGNIIPLPGRSSTQGGLL